MVLRLELGPVANVLYIQNFHFFFGIVNTCTFCFVFLFFVDSFLYLVAVSGTRGLAERLELVDTGCLGSSFRIFAC